MAIEMNIMTNSSQFISNIVYIFQFWFSPANINTVFKIFKKTTATINFSGNIIIESTAYEMPEYTSGAQKCTGAADNLNKKLKKIKINATLIINK